MSERLGLHLIQIPWLRMYLKATEINFEKAKNWATLDVLTFIVDSDFEESLPTTPLRLHLSLTVFFLRIHMIEFFQKLNL